MLPSWKKEIRSKEEIGNWQLKPKNCKNFLVKDGLSPWFCFTVVTCCHQGHLTPEALSQGRLRCLVSLKVCCALQEGEMGTYHPAIAPGRSLPAYPQSTAGIWSGIWPELYLILYSALKWLTHSKKTCFTIILPVLGTATSFLQILTFITKWLKKQQRVIADLTIDVMRPHHCAFSSC